MVATNETMRRALAEEYDERLDRAERALIWLGTQLGGGEEATRSARRLIGATERERVNEAFAAGAIDAAQRDQWLAELKTRWEGTDGTDGGRGER
jgi:dsDNA-binding SOS-regulon protein